MSGRHARAASPRRGRGRHRRPPRRAHFVTPLVVGAVVLGAGGVGAHAAFTGTDHPHPVAPSLPRYVLPSLSAPSVSLPSAASSAAASPTPSASPSRRPHPRNRRQADALVLRVVGGVSWVEVARPGGHVLLSGLVRRGHGVTVRHGPVDVVVGNAGAVHLVRHGHGHGRAGRTGQVLRFRVR